MKRAVDDRIICGHASAAMASKLVSPDGVDGGRGGVAGGAMAFCLLFGMKVQGFLMFVW